MTETPNRKTRNRRRARLSLLAAGPLAAVALLGPLAAAPSAHADTNDQNFLTLLQQHGILDESNQNEIIAAHLVCHQLAQGKPEQEIATDVMSSSTLDGANAGYFVAIAERAYCPQFADIPQQ